MKTVLTTTLASMLAVGSALAAGTEAAAQAGATDQTGMTAGQTGVTVEQTGEAAGMTAGAPAALPMASADIGDRLDTESIRLVQQALADAGYYQGEIDGTWGPQSEEALRQFQAAQGFEAEGNLNDQTLVALGLSEFQLDATGQAAAGASAEPLGTADQERAAGQSGATGQMTGDDQATGTGAATEADQATGATNSQ